MANKNHRRDNYFRRAPAGLGKSFWICLVLTVVTAAVFYQVCSYEFLNFDDSIYVSQNANVQSGITLESVKWAFTTDYACFWHPLTWLSHMLDWQLFGSDPGGHHLSSLIIHIANTLLLFIVLKQMTGAVWPSAFAAALFALHPLHVESVAWVSERKDVLSTFFWILTMWAYVRFVHRPKVLGYLLVNVFFALGLMAKPMLVTLPFVFLLLDFWPLDRISLKGGKGGSGYSLSYLLVEKIPLFVMVLASCIIAFIAQKKGGAIQSEEGYILPVRFANASISYLQYISKMFWPVRLAMFYPHPGRDVSFLLAIISAVVLLGVTVVILRFGKNRRYLVTGWFWYLGTLVPVIGIIQVGAHAMADRYSYITLTGLFIIIAWGADELFGKLSGRKAVLWAGAIVILSSLAIRSYFQQQYWKDTITLCEHALEVTENNYMAHSGMTPVLVEQGRVDEAIWHNTEAVRIKPDYVVALNGLGAVLYQAGRVDEAVSYYKKAVEADPEMPYAYANLGIALAGQGKFAEAVEYYRVAAEMLGTPEIHKDFGDALTKLGKFEEAVAEYRKALSVRPDDPDVLNELGIALYHLKKLDEAVAHFNRALSIDPDHIAAKKNLTVVLEKYKLENAEDVK
ncbi:MAG: tetratricopeptide repeat protein [Sedimentisphaerales bacterium]|nr:tetratricopeptide repeat protein [Sedimentisphaerales bacterium]